MSCFLEFTCLCTVLRVYVCAGQPDNIVTVTFQESSGSNPLAEMLMQVRGYRHAHVMQQLAAHDFSCISTGGGRQCKGSSYTSVLWSKHCYGNQTQTLLVHMLHMRGHMPCAVCVLPCVSCTFCHALCVLRAQGMAKTDEVRQQLNKGKQ